jgi:DNA-binding IscR family transcriptional regulator
MLARRPEDISVGEIVMLLENDTYLAPCLEDPDTCQRVHNCKTRDLWEALMIEVYQRLHSISLKDLITKGLSQTKDEDHNRCYKQA